MSSLVTHPRFISTLPNGIDLFGTGSQEKTAKSISEHITNDTGDFKLIGLDGDWGSGKSNAISIVEKQLDKSFHFFIYDTWAHQEDLQRRSFLEELTDNLQEHSVVNQEKWKTELNNLLAKKKVTTTKTIPTLSWAIITSLAVTLFTPIVKAISESLPSTAAPYWKVLITAAPLIVALIIWVIYSFKDKENWNLTQLFKIYEKEDREKVVDETISENEPSLREFRSWIDKLNEASSKKIVIVFDNMDRLPSEKIKVIWTLLHTFFSSKVFSKIWIIVPFDRKHIRDAFGNENEDKEFEKTNHFINKTFSVIFNISPALSTDWKIVFEHKYTEAFGNTEKEEYNIIRRLFDLYTTSITPRKIISFINEMVSLKMVWGGDIKLRYISVFVLNRQKIVAEPVAQILNKEFLNKSLNLFAGDDSVSDNIAALLYNVPLDKAVQISLQREIELAIRQRRIDDLKGFAKNADFVSILEQIPAEDIEIDAASFCLNEIEFSSEEYDIEPLQLIWDRVISQQLKQDIPNLIFSETMKILLLKCRLKNRKKLIAYLFNQFNKISEFTGSQYFIVLEELEKFVQDNKMDIECLPLIEQKEVASEIFVDYLEFAKEKYSRYKVVCNNGLLDKHFADKVPDNLEKTSILKYLKNDYKFTSLKHYIEQTIRNNKITVTNIVNVFDTYKLISSDTLLQVKLNDVEISSLFSGSEKNSNEYYELSAMRIARGESFINPETFDDTILASSESAFIEEILRRIENYNNYGNLLLSSVTWPKPVLKALLKRGTEDKSFGKSMSIIAVLPKFNQIISSTEIPEEMMLNKLSQWNKYLFEKLTTDNLQKVFPQTSFYSGALKVDNDLTKTAFEVAIKYIKEETIENWRLAFEDEKSYLFELLSILLASNKISEFPDNAFSAYKEALKLIANSEIDAYDLNKEVSDKWTYLFNKSDKIHLQSTIKDIRDSFLKNVEMTKIKFIFFEPILRELGVLIEESGDVVRKILKPMCEFEECLNAILVNRKFYAPIIDSAGNDAFDLIDLLREKVELVMNNDMLNEFNSLINSNLSNKIKIIFAKYYSPQKNENEAINVTNSLRRIVEIEKQLQFKVDNGISEDVDPDEGSLKKLFVKYIYLGSEKEKTFDENTWLKLP